MFCALLGQISGDCLQDHWSSGFHLVLVECLEFGICILLIFVLCSELFLLEVKVKPVLLL